MTRWRILFRDGDIVHKEAALLSYEHGCIVFYNDTPYAPVYVVPTDLVTTIKESND